MLAPDDEVEVEVRLEDQKKINEFGKNNDMLSEWDDEMKVMSEELEKLDDANTELMMQDGENVRLQVADCFITVTEDFCTDYLEKKMEAKQEEVDAQKAKMDALRQRQLVRWVARAGRCCSRGARRRLLLPGVGTAAT